MRGQLFAPMPVVEATTASRRPFWSVMIPCFNSAALLARALESVLAQDEGPDRMQIEVVDDASTEDDAADVVNRVGGGRVSYYRQPSNVGAAANFTTCVRRSQGVWVHLLHSDDVVQAGFYEAYREAIMACPDALMIAAPTILVDADEQEVGVTQPVDAERGYMKNAALVIATSNPLRCVSVVVARRAYEELGGFHPSLFHANDWEMWARVASAGPVAWVEEPKGLYRSHPESHTSRLHRSTAYLGDCVAAVEVMSGHFNDPEQRALARTGGRRVVADYGLYVARQLVGQNAYRTAVANAARAVRISPSAGTSRQAAELLRVAVARRVGLMHKD
jgi:GT2 family glycosyltransferase